MLRKLSPPIACVKLFAVALIPRRRSAQVTKLPKDEVCDALANLLLWTREIRTQIVRHQRMYFVNEDLEELAKSQAAAKRKRSLNPSFSSVGELMPGRKPSAQGPETDGERVGQGESA